MINKLKNRFTKWYVEHGYQFKYDMKTDSVKAMCECPIWVKPLLIFFSPSVYMIQITEKNIAKNLSKYGSVDSDDSEKLAKEWIMHRFLKCE